MLEPILRFGNMYYVWPPSVCPDLDDIFTAALNARARRDEKAEWEEETLTRRRRLAIRRSLRRATKCDSVKGEQKPPSALSSQLKLGRFWFLIPWN